MVLSYCISINYGIFCIIFYLRKKVDYMNNYGMNGWCKEISRENSISKQDSISRQAAIDIADAIWATTGDKNVIRVGEMIKDLPPAQPKRMRGKWNPDLLSGVKPYGYFCNLCGAWHNVKHNYCHNCGADMREVSE